MRLVYRHEFDIPRFVADHIFDHDRGFGVCACLGFADGSELVAGFVFHNWQPEAGVIEVSGYSSRRNWVNKTLLRAIFNYPFNQAGCRVVAARHSEKNKRVIRIWKALGATQVTIPELRGQGEAEVVSVLTKDAWHNSKFMRLKNGQAQSAAAA